MASLSKDGSGWRILFVCPTTKKRRTIRTGRCAKKNAETARHMIERLIEAKTLGAAIDQRTAAWLDSIDDKLRNRLAKAKLADVAADVALKAFLDAVIAQRVRRGDVKRGTVVSWGHTRRNLVEFFEADRAISTITSAEADEWAAWLSSEQELAENTVRKRSANAKMFFKVAVRRKQVPENPFQSLVSSVVPSRGRQYFIPRETVSALLDQCHGPEYRLLLLFARYIGVRVPSEIVPLTWGDVDWDNRRIVITSPKTERHPGGETRICPIFPEVFPTLTEVWDGAPEGSTHVFPSIRSGKKNLRTWLERAIIAADFTPWPRLWQNFRATRATELADKFPSHVAAAWLGHSERIANISYRQTTADHHRRAISQPTGAMPTRSEHLSGELAQKPAHSPHVTVNQGSPKNEANPTNPEIGEVCERLNAPLMGGTGLEPQPFSPRLIPGFGLIST